VYREVTTYRKQLAFPPTQLPTQLKTSVEMLLHNYMSVQKFKLFPLSVNESRDVSDTPWLLSIVCGLHNHFWITKIIFSLYAACEGQPSVRTFLRRWEGECWIHSESKWNVWQHIIAGTCVMLRHKQFSKSRVSRNTGYVFYYSSASILWEVCPFHMSYGTINPLKTERNLLYIKTSLTTQ
jgi:hypothetical protein